MKKSAPPSPANLFIAQDIRPRDLSEHPWKTWMRQLASRAAHVAVGYRSTSWGAGRIEMFQVSDLLFKWLRSGR